MAKRISIINFILISIVVAICLSLSVFSFDIPFGVTNDYAGFAGAIAQDYDTGKGRTVVYEVKPVSKDKTALSKEEMKDASNFVANVLNMFGLNNNQTGVQNDNMIRSQVKEMTNNEAFFNALQTRVEIIVRAEETDKETKYDIPSRFIQKCSVSYQESSEKQGSYSFGVLIEFNSEGRAKYKDLTEYASKNGKTVYFYDTNGQKLASLPNVKTYITTGKTFMENPNVQTEAQITNYAAQVMMGSKSFELKVKENSVATSALGYNAMLYMAITLIVSFVVVTCFMIAKYKDLGLISMLTSLGNVALYLFLLQALPNTFFTMSVAGVVGVIVGFMLTILSHIIIFENIKKEYSLGRKIPLSFKLGFKNSTLKVVDINVVAMLTTVVAYFAGFNILKSMSVAIFVGSLIAIFSSLVMTRVFAKWYLRINSTKPNKLGLKKEASDEE